MSTVPIDDPADPRVSVYLELRDHQIRMGRERTDPDLRPLFLAEGERLIGDALDAGLTPVSMLRDPERPTSVEDRLPGDVPVFLAGADVARRLTGMHIHRGALACFVRPPALGLSQVATDRATTLLVTERVTNPTNLGVMTRSAAGLGFDGLIVDAHSCDPLYRRALRVAMGASLHLPWTRVEDLDATLVELKRSGFAIVAMALSDDAVDLESAPLGAKVALVMGNEFAGLSQSTLDHCDVIARIAMTGGVDSLNVAAAAAIACWEVSRHRHLHRSDEPPAG
jgi:tRNA G18 (ribose-2'-O)-methylase SpoU